jgi:hypothetical protein
MGEGRPFAAEIGRDLKRLWERKMNRRRSFDWYRNNGMVPPEA